MTENFLYSVNVILPIFLLVALGLILKRLHVIGDNFADAVDKLVFKVCLPSMLFLEVAGSELSEALNLRLVLFVIVSISGAFLAVSGIVFRLVHDNGKRGAIIQGICRSNFAILGVPLIRNMFGESGLTQVALVMPVTILLFNIASVIVLSVFAPHEDRLPPRQLFFQIVRSILTNPLVIGVTLGIPFMLLEWELPLAADRTLQYLADLVTPAALISLGSTVRLESLRGRIGYAAAASLTKTVLMPAIMVTCAASLGFRGAPLGIVLVLFGTPTAVSSYIMAKNMKSDYELAGQILLLTTLLCLFTIFIGVFILKSLALI